MGIVSSLTIAERRKGAIEDEARRKKVARKLLTWKVLWDSLRLTRYRYRDQFWPLVLLGVLWVSGALSRGAYPVGVLATSMLGAAVTVFYLRQKLTRQTEWGYAGSCLAAAAGWLVAVSLAPDARWPNVVGVLAWAGLSLVWWRHHEVRGWPGHSRSTLVNDWNCYVRDKQGGPLAGAEIDHPVPFEHGNSYTVHLVRGTQTLSTAQAALMKLETALDIPMVGMIIEQHPDYPKQPSKLRLQHVTRSPIEKTVYFDQPVYEDGNVLLGPYGDGIGNAWLRIYTENSMWSTFVLGGSGIGKALDVDTPIATPSGWTTMGEIQVGDEVFDEHGFPTRVVATSDVLFDRSCYELTFSDGSRIVADQNHQWVTVQKDDRKIASRERSHPPTTVGTPDEIRWTEKALQDTEPGVTASLRELAELAGLPKTRWTPIYGWLADLAPRVATHPRRYDRENALRIILAHLARRRGAAARPTPAPVTTGQIADSLYRYRRANHAVAVAGPLKLPVADLLVDPYVLGCWLGDGSSKASEITTADPEIISNIESAGWRCVEQGRYRFSILSPLRNEQPRPAMVGALCRSCGLPLPRGSSHRQRHQACRSALSLRGQLNILGVLRNKHIPVQYMRGSIDQRLSLMAGLLDTDGTVARSGQVQFTNTNKRLAGDVRDLACSLGYRAALREYRATLRGMDCGPAWTVGFSTTDPVFRLERKRQALREATGNHCSLRNQYRYITNAERVPSRSVKCIQVATASHLYLVGRTLIPTHNSRLIESVAISVLAMRNTVIFYMDGQNGASSSALFKNADWAVGTDGAMRMLAALERGAQWRQKENRVNGWDGFTPSAERPGVLVIIDEQHRIAPLAPERFANAAVEWRKIGQSFLGADQDSGLRTTFAGEDRLRSGMLGGNGIVMNVRSRIAGNLIPGLDINPADLPQIPGYGVTVAAPGSGARTAPFRGRYSPNADEKAKAEAKGTKVSVPTIEEWFARCPQPKLDRGTARAMGRDYTQRHAVAEEERQALLEFVNGPDDEPAIDLDALQDGQPDPATNGAGPTCRDRLLALDWAAYGELGLQQIFTELPDVTNSAVTKALRGLVESGELKRVAHGKYRRKDGP